MKNTLKSLLEQEYITEIGFLPIKDVVVLNQRIMPNDIKSVIVLLAPYDTCEMYQDGISAYAHIRDYHRFFAELYDRLLPKLYDAFPQNRFFGFADHSPIHEKDAAAKAGLGVFGCNSLLINPTYGSYVFLGSLLTDLEIPCEAIEVRYCNQCGKCIEACPGKAVSKTGIQPAQCLSALSQKRKLDTAEMEFLRENRIAWGCDRCQMVCPYNSHRMPTNIPFFLVNRHGDFRAEEIQKMGDAEFSQYAFSWRGRNRITENLLNLVSAKENSSNFT